MGENLNKACGPQAFSVSFSLQVGGEGGAHGALLEQLHIGAASEMKEDSENIHLLGHFRCDLMSSLHLSMLCIHPKIVLSVCKSACLSTVSPHTSLPESYTDVRGGP